VPDERADALLAHADELGRRDAEVAARIEAVEEVLRRADAVRARAAAIDLALAAIPGERARLATQADEAQTREAVAGGELAAAESRLRELEGSRRAGDEQRAQARREVARAREELAAATSRSERVAARRTVLLDDELALTAEAEELAVTAQDVAAAIGRTPRVSESGRAAPGGTLPELAEWGARVHAALFVVRGGLHGERERLVTEANALAASVLGEQLAGASVALVRRRLELALRV
jgi:hypothetical protein